MYCTRKTIKFLVALNPSFPDTYSVYSRDGTGQNFCSPARPELTRNRPARLC